MNVRQRRKLFAGAGIISIILGALMLFAPMGAGAQQPEGVGQGNNNGGGGSGNEDCDSLTDDALMAKYNVTGDSWPLDTELTATGDDGLTVKFKVFEIADDPETPAVESGLRFEFYDASDPISLVFVKQASDNQGLHRSFTFEGVTSGTVEYTADDGFSHITFCSGEFDCVDTDPSAEVDTCNPCVDTDPSAEVDTCNPCVDTDPSAEVDTCNPCVDTDPSAEVDTCNPCVDTNPSAEVDTCNPCVDTNPSAEVDTCNPCVDSDPSAEVDTCNPCVDTDPSAEVDTCNPCVDSTPNNGVNDCGPIIIVIPDCTVNCGPPPPTDECPNIPGDQAAGTDCNPVTDACPLIPGTQRLPASCIEVLPDVTERPPVVTPPVVTPPAPPVETPPAVAPDQTPKPEVKGDVVSRTLPRTGNESRDLAAFGGGLLLLGAGLVLTSRSRFARVD